MHVQDRLSVARQLPRRKRFVMAETARIVGLHQIGAGDDDIVASACDDFARSSSSSNGSNRALKPPGRISSCSCPPGPISQVRTAPSVSAPTSVPPLRASVPIACSDWSGLRGCSFNTGRAATSSGATERAYVSHTERSTVRGRCAAAVERQRRGASRPPGDETAVSVVGQLSSLAVPILGGSCPLLPREEGRHDRDRPRGGGATGWFLLRAGRDARTVAVKVSSAVRVVLVFAALVCCAARAAPAMARSHRAAGAAPASHVVLRSSFRPVRAGVGNVLASGDDLLSTIPNIAGGHDVAPVVINDRLGTMTALDPSCDAQALGPPWVLMECPQSSVPYGPYDVELYSLPDGTREIVKPTPGMPYCSSPPYDPEVTCSASAVGADWIEWVASSYHHLPTSVYFQNIQTGALRRDPTNATTFADLNSAALARRTCPGVRLIATPQVRVRLGLVDCIRSVRPRPRPRQRNVSRAMRDAQTAIAHHRHRRFAGPGVSTPARSCGRRHQFN